MNNAPIITLLDFENTGFQFKVQTIQSLAEEHGEANKRPHSHNYYELIWMIKGKATLHVDLQKHEIENNMIFCLRPSQMHQIHLDPQMEGFVFSFTESFFSSEEHELSPQGKINLFKLFSECGAKSIQPDLEADMKEIAIKMMNGFEYDRLFSENLVKRYFKIFLIYFTQHLEGDLKAGETNRESKLVKKFLELVDKGFRQRRMVHDYAVQLSVTANYLNKAVKQNTGHSAGHHIRQRVVLEAKRLGRFSEVTMKEIAYNLGFIDSAHFSKFFKAVAGMNFSDFRKEGQSVTDRRTA